jgi:hypothetical protein
MPNTLAKPEVIKPKPTALRLAVYGEGGVGKSTLALTFPYPLVIDTDGGIEGDVRSEDVIGEEWSPSGWADLNALYSYIVQRLDSDTPYQTIVIDSIDTLARFILHEAEDIANGNRQANASRTQLITAEQRDYGKVSTAIDIFLTKLKILNRERGIHIVLTSAVRLPDPEKMRFKRTFDVQPAVEGNILYWANVYGELELAKDDDRILWTRAADPKRKNKTRFAALHPGVKDPTFSKINSLIAGGKEGK